MYPSPTALSYPHIALDWFGSPYYSHDLRSLPPIYDFYTVRFLLSIYAVVSWEDVWSLINIYLACCILGVSELLHQCLTSLFWSSDEGAFSLLPVLGLSVPPSQYQSALLCSFVVKSLEWEYTPHLDACISNLFQIVDPPNSRRVPLAPAP